MTPRPGSKLRVSLETDKLIVKEKYPTFTYVLKDDVNLLRGKLELDHEYQGIHFTDQYEIEIFFPDNYPNDLPLVREIGGKSEEIMRKWNISDMRDIHLNPPHGFACLCMRAEQDKYFPKGSNIETFFEKLVIPFFCNLSYFVQKGKLPAEFQHGYKGILQFYGEKLETKDEELLVNAIKLLSLKGDLVKGHWPCPCGSGKKIRGCHPALYERLKQLKTEINPTKALIDWEDCNIKKL